MVLSESVPADIDKVLLGLEAKEFTVEITTLQSLQQLIQWVADLALNILAKLPENKGMVAATRNNGVSQKIGLILYFYLGSKTFTNLNVFSMILAKTLLH